MNDAEPEGVVPCGRGVEALFPVGGCTRERIDVRTETISRLAAESASGSLGMFDMVLQVSEWEAYEAGLRLKLSWL